MRVHPATGWKALWVNRAMTDRIVGLDRAESDLILGYLYDVFEKNVDIQVRFKWSPRTSALWDNRCVFLYLLLSCRLPGGLTADCWLLRVTIHNASWDYEGSEPRHGTRVTALAEKPFFDPEAKSRREALGLLGGDEVEELKKLRLTK